MITSETEIRIALQAVLVSVLALYGFWGCAFLVLIILLPWKPFLAVGGYLAQPVVDWRARKAHDRHEKGIAQIEKELDAILAAPKGATAPPAPALTPKAEVRAKPVKPQPSQRLQRFKAEAGQQPTFQELNSTVTDLYTTLGIPPVIKEHVRNLPQGAFSNMDLEIERVKFNGDAAEAYVKFQSPHVKELIIRQRYTLRKSGATWEVESRQPANGGSKIPTYSIPTLPQAGRQV